MFQEIEVLQLLEAGLYLLDGKQQPDRLHPAATSHQLIEADGIVSVLCGVQRTSVSFVQPEAELLFSAET